MRVCLKNITLYVQCAIFGTKLFWVVEGLIQSGEFFDHFSIYPTLKSIEKI